MEYTNLLALSIDLDILIIWTSLARFRNLCNEMKRQDFVFFLHFVRQIFEIGMSVPRVVLRSSVRHEGNSDWNRNRNPIAIIWLEPDWNRIGTGLENLIVWAKNLWSLRKFSNNSIKYWYFDFKGDYFGQTGIRKSEKVARCAGVGKGTGFPVAHTAKKWKLPIVMKMVQRFNIGFEQLSVFD